MANKLRDAFKIIYFSKYNPLLFGRNITVFDNDFFVVSYPKSGNTWVRFIVANLTSTNKKVDLTKIKNLIPDMYRWSNYHLLKMKKPRYIKSHEYFDPRYRRVLYIVRDPRSIVISYYMYLLKTYKIDKLMSLDEFTKGFVAGKYDNYGTWQENVLSWMSTRENDKNFLLLKYEDLLTNPFIQVQRIAKFINLNLTRKQISKAIEKSSFLNLQKLEKNSQPKNTFLSNSRKDILFFRNGTMDEWKEILPTKSQKLIENRFGKAMKNLGYL